MGPGGGQAIGERALSDTFLMHTPLDRKFELKSIAGKRVCLVGQSIRAAQFASEYARLYSGLADMRLTWIVRSTGQNHSVEFASAVKEIRERDASNVAVMESLGVDQIQLDASGVYSLKLLREDDSTVDVQCDAVASLTQGRSLPLSSELNRGSLALGGNLSFITNEPGLYILRGGSIEQGAGVGLVEGFLAIRDLFALLAGRDDLDLYQIIEKQQPGASSGS